MAKKSTFKTVTVNGQSIDGAHAGRLSSGIAKVGDSITVAAQANVKQWLQHGNADWLRDFLENDAFRHATTGKLTKLGREVVGYVSAFTFITVKETKDGGLEIVQTKNKKNKGKIRLMEKDDDGAPVTVDCTDGVDFPLTFQEWQAAQDGKSDNEPKNKKASTLTSQLEKMVKLLNGEVEGSEVTGSYEELIALQQMAQQVAASATSAAFKAQSDTDKVDVTGAEQLQSVVSTSEKQAG